MASFILVPRSGEIRDGDGALCEVWILRRALADVLLFLLVAGVALVVLAAIPAIRAGRGLAAGGLLLLVIVLVPCAVMVADVTHGLAWWVFAGVTAADGQQYCFLDQSFLQGQSMAIARRRSGGLLYGSYEVLGTTNGDSPRSYLLVVRPSLVSPVPYGALYVTPDGQQLVGVRHDNECYMVYDLASKRFHGSKYFQRGGDVEGLSPFLLLGEATPLHTPDVDSIVASFRRGETMYLPTRESLTAATTHPNPAVRTAAAAMLSAMQR